MQPTLSYLLCHHVQILLLTYPVIEISVILSRGHTLVCKQHAGCILRSYAGCMHR